MLHRALASMSSELLNANAWFYQAEMRSEERPYSQ